MANELNEAVPTYSSVQSPELVFGTQTLRRAAPIDSCLQFAERLGLLAAADGSNFVFSPVSVRAALGLAAAGSGGETLKQMLSFLGSPTVADLNSSAAAMLAGSVVTEASDGGGGACQLLAFVSGVWVDSSMALKPSFQETATSVYSAVAKSVDFLHHAPAVVKEVNNFICTATNGLIKDLIPVHSVSRDTKLILANALHFKGVWANKFDKSETRNGEFHLLDGTTIGNVPFMKSRRKQFVSTFDGFKVLRLPYQSGQQRSFSMLIFLPDDRDGLSSLVRKAVSQPNFLNRHSPNHTVRVGELSVPKFKMSSDFEATEVLRGLGLELPFDREQADFGEMADSTTGGRLYVSSVHHKATVEVEEEGTVAAAATAITFEVQCYVPPVEFRADHPFMFAIREEVSGAVLFLGHVANPSQLVD